MAILENYLVSRVLHSFLLYIATIVLSFSLLIIPAVLYGATPFGFYLYDLWFWRLTPSSAYYEEIIKWGLVPNPDAAEWINMFFRHMVNCISGDYGYSFLTNRPVSYELHDRIGFTGILVAASFFTSLFLGSWIVSHQEGDERGKNSWKGQVLSYLSSSTPIHWLGMMLLFAFGFALPAIVGFGFPQFGTVAYEVWEIARLSAIGGIFLFVDVLFHLTLPLTTLVLVGSLFIYSIFKEHLTNNLTEKNLILQSKQGYNSQYIFYSNLKSVIEHLKMWVPVFLCSVLLVEVVFTWRGIFQFLYGAILRLDYPVMRGSIIVIGTFVIAIQFILDAAFFLLIRFDRDLSTNEKYAILAMKSDNAILSGSNTRGKEEGGDLCMISLPLGSLKDSSGSRLENMVQQHH